MDELEELERARKIREILSDTNTSILTPNLGKGFHLINSYYRVQFIAKVIEYMVYVKSVYGIDKVRGDVILNAVCKHSWYLNYLVAATDLELLLIEISAGLCLLDAEELGTISIPNPLYRIDKNQKAEIKKFLGYNFKLSQEGWEAYRKQEYQVLASNLFAARLNRCISYIAVLIALISLLVACFKQ